MGQYSEMTVGQKLAKARMMFLKEGIKKSGKNMKLEFTYFELKDIMEIAIPIFDRLGLINDMSIEIGDKAVANVINAEKMEEKLTFSISCVGMDQIISSTGKVVTPQIQTVGATETYYRRYLWLMVLEVIEPDEIDSRFGFGEAADEAAEKPKVKQSEVKTPATVEERAEIKKELTSEEKQASEEQLNHLKEQCKQLRAADEKMDDFVQKVALKTNGFTVIGAEICAELSKNLDQILAEYQEKE